jgi:hypothetical protein
MLTKSRSRKIKTSTSPRKRSLSVENLETRLNLSTLATTAASRLHNLTTPVAQQTATYNNVNLISTSGSSFTDPASDPFNNLKFGDTAISTTGTTTIDPTS